MKKVLKNLEPSIRSYLGDAFCFSIIDDVAFESGWVYDKYIHMEYTPEDGQIKYADYDYYDFVPGEGVFIKSFTQIPIGCCEKEKICRQIEEMIDGGEYFFALWDENVITNYLYGESRTDVYEHGCFLYGYDSDARMFDTQGYLGEEKWKRVQVPYDVFYQALSYFPEKGEIAYIGYELVKDNVWQFDFDRMKRGITDYCCSLQGDTGRILDLRAEKTFFEQMRRSRRVHYPSLYCIYEHKKVMRRRAEFLNGQYLAERGEELCESARQLEKEFKKVMLLGVQFLMNHPPYLLEEIVEKAVKAVEDEQIFLEQLTQRLFHGEGSS